jgi:hypothetical protein
MELVIALGEGCPRLGPTRGPLRWGMDRSLFLQVVASHALPGKALKEIGADKPWATLYVGF